MLTPDGEKNIEDIQVGDWVVADDPTTPGGVAPKQVMNTFVRQTEALVDLYVDGELISTTGEHPFWVADKGWVEASDLQVGDLLQTDEETFVDIDRIEKREGDFEVYNFDVEGFSTYFVSDLGVLVHNAGYPTGKLQHSFKHAGDFGISGNWNKDNAALFQKALQDHIDNAPQEIPGTFRWKKPVI
ncbi:MAG: polymorphic toxin-type HINT domain-containing protein [Spirulinaceae cyanobacterium]